jgi:hypothetical protein
MSAETSGVNGSQDVAAQQAAAEGATTTATKKGLSADAAANTFVTNANQLKEKAPEVYNAMVDSLARKICDDLKKHAARMKKIMREGQRQG